MSVGPGESELSTTAEAEVKGELDGMHGDVKFINFTMC